MPSTDRWEDIAIDQDHDRRRELTREDLHALVWKRPMSRLAKSFGLSDVGLRKICVKHAIPTPGLGYWAKLGVLDATLVLDGRASKRSALT